MKKKFSLDLLTLSLAVLTAAAIPFFMIKGGYCPAPGEGSVFTSVSADSLSAVSGTDLFLRLSLDNRGDEGYDGGSVIISVERESQKGDFSEGNDFVVTRAVVKKDLDLPARSSEDLSFAWSIPAALPSGVYTIDAAYAQGGRLFQREDESATPFGGKAKVLISGESLGAVYFIAGNEENDEPSLILKNASGRNVTLPVTVRMYQGDVVGSPLRSETRVVSVPAGSSLAVDYEFPYISGAFGVLAETAYKGVPTFYVFSPNRVGCIGESALYAWAMTIGGLGVVMLLLVHFRRERITYN